MSAEEQGESRVVVVVGAGIVGASLAHLLASQGRRGEEVVLIDTDVSTLSGSTGIAPGLVGQFNEIPVLTELAKRSVQDYLQLPGGAFEQIGGLEVATTKEGSENLSKRRSLAIQCGLQAKILDGVQAERIAPTFIRKQDVVSALHFPQDGVADPKLIAKIKKQSASEAGAKLVSAKVQGLLTEGTSSQVYGVKTDKGDIAADTVVICTGIWAKELVPWLPVYPVGHPYTFSQPSREFPRSIKMPFVRWPEQHVYARDHGLIDGAGSYAHTPVLVESSDLAGSALGQWRSDFDAVLQRAFELMPEETSRDFLSQTQKQRAFNGIFSVTPDGKPLVGPVAGYTGLYCAVAVWVTHAYGAAKLLADMLSPTPLSSQDHWLAGEVDPNRFKNQDEPKLKAEAIATYNDVYNKSARRG